MNGLQAFAGITLALAALPAAAVDGVDLVARSKMAATSSAPQPAPRASKTAPFTVTGAPTPDPMNVILYNEERDQQEYRGECRSNGGNLCYDKYSNTVVYRPVRNYMPTIPGLTAENISLKRSGIVLKYSFK